MPYVSPSAARAGLPSSWGTRPRISDRLAGTFVPPRGIHLVVGGKVYRLPEARGEIRWNVRAETAWVRQGDRISTVTAEGVTPGDPDGLTAEHWNLL